MILLFVAALSGVFGFVIGESAVDSDDYQVGEVIGIYEGAKVTNKEWCRAPSIKEQRKLVCEPK